MQVMTEKSAWRLSLRFPEGMNLIAHKDDTLRVLKRNRMKSVLPSGFESVHRNV